MIGIFNGKMRSLGDGGKPQIYVRLGVKFRKHICVFTAASPSALAVFMCIALHIDENGWARLPGGLKQVAAETGLSEATVSAAVGKLCAMTIDGKRVMLAYQERLAHNHFSPYRYMVFPSDEDLARYDAGQKFSQTNKQTKSAAPQLLGGGEGEIPAPQSSAPGSAAPGQLGGIGITLNGRKELAAGADAPAGCAPGTPEQEPETPASDAPSAKGEDTVTVTTEKVDRLEHAFNYVAKNDKTVRLIRRGRASENAKDFTCRFYEATGLYMTSVREWLHGGQQLYEACKGDWKIADKAIKSMRAARLTIASPHSLVRTAAAIRAERERGRAAAEGEGVTYEPVFN